jgi:hypothetical protein
LFDAKKVFFFEKENQKTFSILGSLGGTGVVVAAIGSCNLLSG